MCLPYPISTNRYWRGRGTRTYLSKEAKAYKARTKQIAEVDGLRPFTDRVAVKLTVLPKSKKDGTASKVVIDLDNAAKVTIDALNGVAYVDDRQVRRLLLEYGEAVKGGGLIAEVMPYGGNSEFG